MGKKTLFSSIAIGAVVGGALSLFNKETRSYVKQKSSEAADQASYYAQHPNEAISNLKQTVTDVTSKIEENKTGALNTLDQVENTIGKVFKK